MLFQSITVHKHAYIMELCTVEESYDTESEMEVGRHRNDDMHSGILLL